MLRLVEETGLEEAIRNELYERWKADEHQWPKIKQELSLLDTACKALKRMAS